MTLTVNRMENVFQEQHHINMEQHQINMELRREIREDMDDVARLERKLSFLQETL